MDETEEVVLTARRTESVDAPAIEKLTNSISFELFGRVDIVRVMYVYKTCVDSHDSLPYNKLSNILSGILNRVKK